MDPKKLSKLDWWIVGAAAALVIDLAALPWIDVSIGPVSYTSAGTGSPDGFLGLLALLAALGVAVDLLLARFMPSMRIAALERFGRTKSRLFGAAAALLLLVLKLVLHLHPSYLGVGCWIALALAAVLTVFSYRSLNAPAAGGAPAPSGMVNG